MTRLVGNPITSVLLIFNIRRNPDALHEIKVNGYSVRFRGADEQALREVLVDNEYSFLRESLHRAANGKVLDIGCHIGTFAVWCLGEQPNVSILSVEADPLTFEIAHRNSEIIQSQGKSWSVQHAAAGGTDGEMLKLSACGPSMSHKISESGSISVPSISFGSLIEQIAPSGDSVDLVKIDIEGSEEAFLCEGVPDLSRVRALVVELHPGLCNTQRVEALLRNEFNSVISVEGRQSTKPLLFCQRAEGQHD